MTLLSQRTTCNSVGFRDTLAPDLSQLVSSTLTRYSVTSETDKMLVLLDALEKIGDARSIPLVNRLRKRRVAPGIAQRMEAILETLTERQSKAREASTLLRSSEQPEARHLLRPAVSASEMPEHLLRACSRK